MRWLRTTDIEASPMQLCEIAGSTEPDSAALP